MSSTAPGELDNSIPLTDEEYLSASLDPLHAAFAVNSILLKSLNPLPSVMLEIPTRKGRIKFWRAIATHEGVLLRWGRTGTHGQQRLILKEKCKDHSPLKELEKRTRQKVKKGYFLDRQNCNPTP